jgi:cobalt-zinc-cadmium efflux system protein
MAHDHHHHHHHHSGEELSTANIRLAFWLNTGFAVLEIVGGLLTNSVAIMSDALHDFGDSLSLGLSWYFHKKAKKKRDNDYSYGYRRFSLLGAFINSLILVLGSVFIVQESIARLVNPEHADARGMIILAVIGIAVNAMAMLRLKKGNSVNERVVSLHFLEDVLGWVAVLIGSCVMYFYDVPMLDPILSIGISCYILFNVYKNLHSIFKIILQGVPENSNDQEIREKLKGINGVAGVHDIHAWSMDGQYNILTLHVVVSKSSSPAEVEKIKNEVRHCLQHLKFNHITIETEPSETHCQLENC